jgi:hypothetical protein
LGTHVAVQQQTAFNLAKQLGALDYKTLKQKSPEVDHLKTELPLEIISPFVWADPLDTDYAKPWPRGKIPYIVHASVTDPVLIAAIEQAVSDWNSLSIVQIKPASAFLSSEIPSTHPLRIYSTGILKNNDGTSVDPNTFLCFAYIGYDARPPGSEYYGNYMYLSNQCERWNIVHELGHTLGLRHEHVRMDREAFMQVDTSLIKEDRRYSYDKQEGQSLGLSYDPCSMMHYGDTVYKDSSTTGREEKWFTLKEAGQTALTDCRQKMSQACGGTAPGQRCGFSPLDVEIIRRLYR